MTYWAIVWAEDNVKEVPLIADTVTSPEIPEPETNISTSMLEFALLKVTDVELETADATWDLVS